MKKTILIILISIFSIYSIVWIYGEISTNRIKNNLLQKEFQENFDFVGYGKIFNIRKYYDNTVSIICIKLDSSNQEFYDKKFNGFTFLKVNKDVAQLIYTYRNKNFEVGDSIIINKNKDNYIRFYQKNNIVNEYKMWLPATELKFNEKYMLKELCFD